MEEKVCPYCDHKLTSVWDSENGDHWECFHCRVYEEYNGG